MRFLMMTGAYKNDELVRCVCGTESQERETALGSYARVCEILMSHDLSLSEYIFRLAVDGLGEVYEQYEATESELLFSNIRRDIESLAEFAKISSKELSASLRERFPVSDDVGFPVYKCGQKEITAESVFEFRKSFGNWFYAENKAFIFEKGELKPIKKYDTVRLSGLKRYETQRQAVVENTLAFIKGSRYSNALLYGDRGTGKSSTIKAVVNEYSELRIVLVPKSELCALYDLYGKLEKIPLKFVLFMDDMIFSGDEPEYTFLKQALEGSVCVMPENCVIYAATNRQHIVRENVSEFEDGSNSADVRDEKASLADRFGLYVTFYAPDKNTYLDIVKQIVSDRNIDIPENDLSRLAERFAVRKGSRSPRTAAQFADKLEARLALGLDPEKI